MGIASGYATLGLLGGEERTDYTAVGSTVNLAARLCADAADGQILMDRRALLDAEDDVEAEPTEPRRLKGYAEPVECYVVSALREPADIGRRA